MAVHAGARRKIDQKGRRYSGFRREGTPIFHRDKYDNQTRDSRERVNAQD